VTGTDTGVGKTRVACSLIRAFAARGLRVAGMKPIAAGMVDTPGGPRNDDALALLAASTSSPPYPIVNPYLFTAPIAPHIAAAEAGVAVSLHHIVDCHAELAASHDLVVVEGAGGLLVPIDGQLNFADLARDLGAGILLVVGLRLGCLNHALLTAEAIAARRLPLVGWAGSTLDPGFDRIAANLATLRACIDAPCWGTLGHRPDPDVRIDAQDFDSGQIERFADPVHGSHR
jgi:dethiobiotin synthetase